MSTTKRTRKPSAKAAAAQEAQQLLDEETITVEPTPVEHHEHSISPANIQALILLITRQSQGINTIQSELTEIKAEQRALKAQNAELQEEMRSLRAQLQSYSASTPSARSYASVTASTPATQSTTSLISSGANERTRKEVNCLRISTQANQQSTDQNDDIFARYLTPARAKEHIQNALRQTETTKEVKVAGVGTTKTGYVIRFKEEQSFTTAEANTEWLDELGNDTKLVKPRFGVVVHRFPTEGISLPENKQEVIHQIMEENDMQANKINISDIAWLKQSDKALGKSASLGIWFDTAEAMDWAVINGIVHEQRYIGSVEKYSLEKKRCHRCQGHGHLARRCRKTPRCGHCGDSHDRRDCPPGREARCVDCKGAHPTGAKECNGPTVVTSRQ
jgi:hypothetical protein